jgi:hypothetical protein
MLTQEFSSCFFVNLPPDKIADALIEFYVTKKKVVLVYYKNICATYFHINIQSSFFLETFLKIGRGIFCAFFNRTFLKGRIVSKTFCHHLIANKIMNKCICAFFLKYQLKNTGRPRIWYLVLPKFFFFFLNVVPGTKCSSKIFQKFFRSKKKVFGPVKISKKNFICIFFIDFLGSLYRYQRRKSGTFRI